MRIDPNLVLEVTIAVVSLGGWFLLYGLVLFATSIVFPPGFFLFGWIPPAFGMALVWYEQRQFNQAARAEAVFASAAAVTPGMDPR